MFDLAERNPEVVVAIATVLASMSALLSVVLTTFSIIQTRKHNEMSVRPIARFILGDYDDHLYIRISNSGLGPLIVSNFQILHNGVKLETDNLIEAINIEHDNIVWETFSRIIPGLTINSDKERTIMSVKISTDNPEQIHFRDALRASLSEFSLICFYKDIYERKVYVVKKDLSWFGRRIGKEYREPPSRNNI